MAPPLPGWLGTMKKKKMNEMAATAAICSACASKALLQKVVRPQDVGAGMGNKPHT
jgi:hypothetical protein